MGSIKAGGLASGMDTNALVEKLVAEAKAPIVELQDRNYLYSLEKNVYSDVNSELTALKKYIFDFRIESTFKSKVATTSSQGIVNFSSTASATKGSHVIEVLQTAKGAFVSSGNLSTLVNGAGAGITGVKSGSASIFSKQEGTTYTEVYQDQKDLSKYVAYSQFESNTKKIYRKETAISSVSSDFVDNYGKIATKGEKTFKSQLMLEDGSTLSLKDIPINLGENSGEISDINHLMSRLEDELNSEINVKLGTSLKQYVALRAVYNSEEGTWKTSIYNTSDEKILLKSQEGDLNTFLALDDGTNVTQERQITKYIVGKGKEDLASKLSSTRSSIVYGVALNVSDTGLSTGKFQIYQDFSMNSKKATNSVLISAVNNIHDEASLSKPLKDIGLLPAGSNLDGIFSINGKKIEIKDSLNKSINDIIAIINSSGAGVKGGFDVLTGRFVFESNSPGFSQISVGEAGDTSSIGSIFKLSPANGATFVSGDSSGNISTSSPINKAGFTYSITKGTFTINDVAIYVDPSQDSVDDIIKKVNASSAGVTLSYDSLKDIFVMSSKKPDQIVLGSSSDTSNLLSVFGLSPIDKLRLHVGESGAQAIVNVDGTTYYKDSNTFDDIISGARFTAVSKGIVTVELDVDTDRAINALAEFIKEYNVLVDKLKMDQISRLDRKEKMAPLTEEKKAKMDKDSIKKYMEEYNKLHSQDTINNSREMRSLRTELRNLLVKSPVNNSSQFKTLFDIGITIAQKDGDDGYKTGIKGWLAVESTDLDEIKKALKSNSELMKNLTNKSEEVYKFFADYKEASKDSLSDMSFRESWAKNFENFVNFYSDSNGIFGEKIRQNGTIDSMIRRNNERIDILTNRADDYLKSLWQQFTMMETRIAKINSQSEYINKISQNMAAASGKK